MAQLLKALAQSYAEALAGYLSEHGSKALAGARQIGALASEQGLNADDLAAIHSQALKELARGQIAVSNPPAARFLAEALDALRGTPGAKRTEASTVSRREAELEAEVARLRAHNEELERSNRLMLALLDASTAVIYVKDRQGRVLFVNGQRGLVPQEERQRRLGRTLFDNYPGEVAQSLLDNDRKVWSSGQPLEVEEIIPSAEGPRTFISLKFPLRDQDGTIYAVGGVSTDITERKQAEVKLRQLEDLFRNAQWGMAITGPHGSVNEKVNPAYAQMHGYSEAELEGVPIIDLYAPQDREYAWRQIQRTFEVGRNRFEALRLRKDGSTFPALITTIAVKDEQGRIVYGAGSVLDITEQKQAQRVSEEMKATEQANRELEAFSYAVAHDLRGPLHIIEGFSRVLGKEFGAKLDARGQSHLTHISEAVRNMAGTIEDLLTLSGVTHKELNRESVDLAQLARETLAQLCASAPQRQVEFVAPPSLPEHADPRLCAMLLGNLLGNAFKFTAKRERARIELGVQPHLTPPVYYVRDNGAGFDMAYADKLFAPFQRLHSSHDFEGTGIGLTTVHRIINRHGGRVWAEAAPDQGATFYFTLSNA
ncbi:MAG TPA: PAS domain-containing protein [Candidatus Binataceae bacterium]|nr:PAS domain-containing protein [Candidatus Binataceae bacterium]